MENSPIELAIVSGLSGAGRSTAARALEDAGWFVIDNLPPQLLATLIETVSDEGDLTRIAVVVDCRAGKLFTTVATHIAELKESLPSVRVLFLEASDESLVRRFESNRRPHPLQGKERISDGIDRERRLLADVRGGADLVIDTTSTNVHDLRRKVQTAFGDDGDARLRATIMSFGFKYGIPVDADLVADVRFLPNPYWEEALREQTGRDAPVSDYVTSFPEAAEFLDRYSELIDMVAEGYLREGKRYVTIAIGCTGGKHRSVAMSEQLSARLVRHGVETLVMHRDLGRE